MAFDYSSFDWLNRVIYPCLTTAFILYLYFRLMKKGRIFQNEKLNFAYQPFVELAKEIRFKFDSNLSCVYLPLALAFASLLAFKVLGLGAGGYNEPLWLATFTSVVLAPINEELIWRGLLFGVFILALLHVLNLAMQGKIREWKFEKLPLGLVLLGIAFQGLLFGWMHENDLLSLENHHWGDIIVRSYSGTISAALFYFNRKNLAPAMAFHAFWNLLIIMSNPFILF